MVGLRLLKLTDAALLADYHRRNEEFHRPWSPLMPPEHTTVAFQKQRLRDYLRRHVCGDAYRFGIFTDATDAVTAPVTDAANPTELLLGLITLTAVERSAFQNGRLGYSIDQQFKNRGLLTVNLRQVIHYAFGELKLHRLEANILPYNGASRRVLEKCGFQKIGYSPKYLQIQGIWQDHELYMLLAPWLAENS